MKSKRKFISLILLALLLSSGLSLSLNISPVHAVSINFVSNYSFEDGTTGWALSGWNPGRTLGGAQAGSYWIKHIGETSGFALQAYQDLPNLETNMVTEISFYLYAAVTSQYSYTYVQLVIYYQEGGYDVKEWNPYLSWGLGTAWRKCTFSGLASGKHISRILVQIDTGSGCSTVGIDTFNVSLDIPFSVSADLEPDSTGSDWVFTDWKYYTFNLGIPDSAFSGAALDYVFIGFTEILTSNGTTGFSAWTNGTGWDCAFNTIYSARDLEPIRVKQGSWSDGGTYTNITFPLWFTKKCLDLWLDANAVDVWVYFNDTAGNDYGWYNISPNFFRVYTDGGFSRVSSGYGDSGTLPGGRDFNMFAYNDSYVFKDLYWRNLQHIKMVPEIQFRAGYQYFQFNWGVDYILQDGTYQPGLHLQLEPDAVSYTGVFASNVWINYTASWYANNSLIKSEDLYAFYHGEVYTAGDYGRVKFFIDFWFDAGNASSLQGGRINAYEFPMKDDSGAWFRWLSSNWGVKDDVQKQSECMVPLIKYGAEEYINSERIEFVRVWSSLSVPGAQYNQYVAAINYDVFDLTLGDNPLKGIQTPPWDETNMPAMRNTGVLGAIWSMFQGIAKWIGDNILFGGLSLWTTFVAFLDTIAGWLGAPYFFTNLFNWIGEGFGYLINSAGYAWTVIASIFIMIGQLLAAFITTLGELITSFVTTLSMFVDFMGGGLGAAGNLWDTFQISTWITLAIIFYPIYLIILWDQKGLDAVITQLTWIFGILVWLYGFFRSLIELIIHFITGLIESIPVAE